MTIQSPDNRFRLRILLWGGNYRGEQPFTSAPQKNLADVLMLTKQIKAGPMNAHIRSYVIQEDIGDNVWFSLEHSDWCDLI